MLCVCITDSFCCTPETSNTITIIIALKKEKNSNMDRPRDHTK